MHHFKELKCEKKYPSIHIPIKPGDTCKSAKTIKMKIKLETAFITVITPKSGGEPVIEIGEK